MEFFDSHSHYNDEKFNEDREQIIQDTYNEGITKFICAGYDINSSIKSLEISKKYEFIYSICGISPNDITQSEQKLWKDIDEITKIAVDNIGKKLVAIGEIGLDYYWNKENKEMQKQAFIKQIELANKLELPIVIHSRDAFIDTIEIIKKEASIMNFNIKEEAGKLVITFKVEDEDNTLTNGKVVIENELGQKQYEQSFNQIENTIEIQKDENKLASKYIVKIIGDCNLEGEGITHEDHKYIGKEIYKEEKEAELSVKIVEVVPEKYYTNKNETIGINYTIQTNKTEAITKLHINGEEYEVEEVGENKYKVKVITGNTAGVVEYKLEKIIIGTQEVIKEHRQKIEILKEIPKIENYRATDNIEENKIETNEDNAEGNQETNNVLADEANNIVE